MECYSLVKVKRRKIKIIQVIRKEADRVHDAFTICRHLGSMETHT